MKVYEKLNRVRLALLGTQLKKSGKNTFAGYSYFELDDFIPAAIKAMANEGLTGIVSYGETLASLTITCHEDGSSVVITSPMSSAALKGCHEVQNLGAVQTYIRRYLWVTALEIVEHDALDAKTGDKEVEKKPDVLTSAQEALLQGYRAASLEGLAELKKFHLAVKNAADRDRVWNLHGDSLKVAASAAVKAVSV